MLSSSTDVAAENVLESSRKSAVCERVAIESALTEPNARMSTETCADIIRSQDCVDKETVLRAINTIMIRPKQRSELKKWRQPERISLRIEAIRALSAAETRSAAPILAGVLLQDLPEVRLVAKESLATLGDLAAAPLVETVQRNEDWPLDGMLETISALGAAPSFEGSAALISILVGLRPAVPRRIHRRRRSLTTVCGLLAAFPSTYFGLLEWDKDQTFSSYLVGFIAWLSLILACQYPILFNDAYRKRREAERLEIAAGNALALVKDPQTVPRLLEIATGSFAAAARGAARVALLATLPELNGTHEQMLADTERNLCKLLPGEDRLALAAVRTLEFAGTGQSAALVEKLVLKVPNMNDAGLRMEIRLEAERVLPVLKARLARETAARMLLRAADRGGNGEVLLRPSNSLGEDQPAEQLLRASNLEAGK